MDPFSRTAVFPASEQKPSGHLWQRPSAPHSKPGGWIELNWKLYPLLRVVCTQGSKTSQTLKCCGRNIRHQNIGSQAVTMPWSNWRHVPQIGCCLTLFTCALCSSLLSIVGLLGCRVEHLTLNYRQHPKHFPMSLREDVLGKLHLLPCQSKGRHQSAKLFGYENKSLKQRSFKLCVKTSATAAWRVWDRAETTWEEEFPICPM